MKTPLSITFHGMAPSPWMEKEIRDRADKLETYCRDIISCHVAVDVPHRHHAEGNRFTVRIDLIVPGDELAVTRAATIHPAGGDAQEQDWAKRFEIEGERKHPKLVLRQTFDVAKRRLQDYARRRRAAVKTHEPALRGHVVAWSPVDEFGAIETADGRELVLPSQQRAGAGARAAACGCRRRGGGGSRRKGSAGEHGPGDRLAWRLRCVSRIEPTPAVSLRPG